MSLEPLLASVRKNLRAGQYKYAALDLRSAKGLAPNNPEVWFLDGVVNARLENFGEAVSSFEKARSLGYPEDSEFLYYYGYSLMRNGQYTEAITHLQKSIDTDPDVASSHYFLALCFYALKDYGKALKAAKKAAELDPSDADYKRFVEELTKAAS